MSPRAFEEPRATPELPPDESVGAAAAPVAEPTVRLRSIAGVGVVSAVFPLDFRESDVIEVPRSLALAAVEAYPSTFVIESPAP